MSTPYGPQYTENQPDLGAATSAGWDANQAPQAAMPGQPQYAPAYDQSPYGQPAYAQAGYGYGADVESLKSNAMVALVLGILGLFMIGLFGTIPAWVWGNSILKKAQAAGIPESVVGNAKIAKIVGIVGTVLQLIAGAFLVLIFIIGIIGAIAESGTY